PFCSPFSFLSAGNTSLGTSASMSCKLESTQTVHWYKQLHGEQPKRILYESGGTPVFDSTSDRNRMQVRSDSAQPIYHLTINSLIPRDSGIYFSFGFSVLSTVQKSDSTIKDGFQESWHFPES
uniref:Immunoglobulin V-set domain-containing protein n=1 Tax=Ficedula albicollis TaxID=59894 RepID=A0A803WD46_FICAL